MGLQPLQVGWSTTTWNSCFFGQRVFFSMRTTNPSQTVPSNQPQRGFEVKDRYSYCPAGPGALDPWRSVLGFCWSMEFLSWSLSWLKRQGTCFCCFRFFDLTRFFVKKGKILQTVNHHEITVWGEYVSDFCPISKSKQKIGSRGCDFCWFWMVLTHQFFASSSRADWCWILLYLRKY